MSRYLKRVVLAAVVASLVGLAAFSLPTHSALAHEDESSQEETTTTVSDDDDTEASTEAKNLRLKELRTEAAEELKQKREENKEAKTAELKKRVCENRKNIFNARTNNIARKATTHLELFNSIFERVKTFKTEKELDVANYESLVAAVDAAKTDATASVGALKSLDTPIDCAATDPASTVAEFKAAVADAHTKLKTYRTSLKELIKAVRAAIEAGNSGEEQ